MKTRILFLITALGMILLGCSTPRYLQTEQKDSIRIETRVERIFERDTLILEIPVQSEKQTVRDSTSHLENEYAESDARVNTDGTLFHSLNTKPQKKPIPFDKPVERKDSIVYINKEVKVPYPIEKKLSWWEQTSVRYFPLSLGLIALSLIYILRKPLRSLIRRFI